MLVIVKPHQVHESQGQNLALTVLYTPYSLDVEPVRWFVFIDRWTRFTPKSERCRQKTSALIVGTTPDSPQIQQILHSTNSLAVGQDPDAVWVVRTDDGFGVHRFPL